MITLTRALLLLALSSATVVTAQAARPSASLYDQADAKPLSAPQQGLFGPRSGKFRYDSRMVHAAEIAAERAHPHSTSRCWHYVKTALLAAQAVATYPKTEYAKQAGTELQNSFGYKKLKVQDPYLAPVGSVLVYGGRGAGHVELRTPTGFASDFTSPRPSTRPLLGVYVKPRA